MQINYQQMIDDVAADVRAANNPGKVASYIPELACVDADKLGIHLMTVGGDRFSCGDSEEKFSIQSVSKVLSLTLALELMGEDVWKRVGVEPSGTAFNSLVQLEYEQGFPRNPLINAGAIVVCDALIGCLENPKAEILNFVRELSGSDDIEFSSRVFESEKRTGFKNHSLANLCKGFGNLNHDVDTVLDVYFHLCSIEMTCSELAKTFLFLASDGKCPLSAKQFVHPVRAKRINSIMQMCGFYDEAGDFAFRVGLPGKSGVGGGIAAVHPGKYSIAVWSPKLNEKGNSYQGIKVLEGVTSRLKSSIF